MWDMHARTSGAEWCLVPLRPVLLLYWLVVIFLGEWYTMLHITFSEVQIRSPRDRQDLHFCFKRSTSSHVPGGGAALGFINLKNRA
jgi:hypothetical protein